MSNSGVSPPSEESPLPSQPSLTVFTGMMSEQEAEIAHRFASEAVPWQRAMSRSLSGPGPVYRAETLLLEGLGLLLDYFNNGNSAEKLRATQQDADRWCRTFYSPTRMPIVDAAGYAVHSLPRCILNTHPFLLDLGRVSHDRLDSALTPDLTDDSSSGSSDDSHNSDARSGTTDDDAALPPPPAVHRSFRLPPNELVDAACYRAQYTFPEDLLPGAKTRFLNDETLDRLVARYDAEHRPWHLHIVARLRTIRVSAYHLRQSPLLCYMPEMILHLAAMPPVPDAYAERRRVGTMPDFSSDEVRLHAWETGLESRGRLRRCHTPPLLQVPPPSPVPGASPLRVRRMASSQMIRDSSVESQGLVDSSGKGSSQREMW